MDFTLHMPPSVLAALYPCLKVYTPPAMAREKSWYERVLRSVLGVTPAQAAVATDAVTTAYHAITRRGDVKSHETIFLFGFGGLGFNALQIIRHIGARVIVSDIREERLEAAAKLGIPRQDLVSVGASVQDFVKDRGLQGRIDTVLDFVGTQQTFEDAQQIGRSHPSDRGLFPGNIGKS